MLLTGEHVSGTSYVLAVCVTQVSSTFHLLFLAVLSFIITAPSTSTESLPLQNV